MPSDRDKPNHQSVPDWSEVGYHVLESQRGLDRGQEELENRQRELDRRITIAFTVACTTLVVILGYFLKKLLE